MSMYKEKIVFINGTSNSIMKHGYTCAINKNYNTLNYSVGGAPCLMGEYNRACVGKNHFDVEILDFSINDTIHLDEQRISLELLRRSIRNLYRNSHINNRKSISLLLPDRNYLNDPKKSIGYLEHKNNAISYGVNYIDIYKFISIITRNSTITHDDLFINDRHLNEKISYYVGYIVKNTLDYIFTTSNHRNDYLEFNSTANSRIFNPKGIREEYIESTLRNEVVQIHASNSLILLNNSPNEDVLGFLSVSYDKNHYVNFSGDSDRKIRVRKSELPNYKPQFKFIPIFDNSNIDTNNLNMKITTDKEPTKTEGLGICGFLIQKKQPFPFFKEFDYNTQQYINDQIYKNAFCFINNFKR